MLSIGVFTYSIKPRGSVVHAVALTEALVAAGHDATLYALGKPGARLYRPLACPVVLLPAGAAPADPDALIQQRIGEFVDGCARLARRHDVVHAQDCLAANALLALRDRGVGSGSIVRTVHHVERFESPYLARLPAPVDRRGRRALQREPRHLGRRARRVRAPVAPRPQRR